MNHTYIGPFGPERVSCHVRGTYSFPPKVTPHRKRIWGRHKRRWPRDFDGPLVRLSRSTVTGGSVYLECGRTGYGDYIASRDPFFGEAFPGVMRADPIGMTIIVIGSDRRLLVSRRSEYVDQNPGAIAFIGGYAEPPSVDGPLDLFGQAARELREETGIIDVDPAASWILGGAYDPTFCHPEIFFVLRATVPGEALLDNIGSAVDADETQSFQLLPFDDLYDAKKAPVMVSWNYSVGCAMLRRMPHMV
jgi:8-oxo-dGTP pyrophosphatase MutT (NUDIX family)